ncbi:MAG: DNA mismatch endonuclease Vsr [Deltaproteobacteria bacterium]|nr:MAG: DNA mismatch endonuclease Vsr [Deltaproteobacteria bacterium]
MADIVDKKMRSRMMSGIRSRDTKPEVQLRRVLHAAGFRYRLHVRSLPGTPDLVLPKHRAVIEVRGCFWHRHHECRFATTPATNPEFWQRKFAENVERDARNLEALTASNWRVAVVWECALRLDPDATGALVMAWLRGEEPRLVLGQDNVQF